LIKNSIVDRSSSFGADGGAIATPSVDVRRARGAAEALTSQKISSAQRKISSRGITIDGETRARSDIGVVSCSSLRVLF
jgi:fructose-specific phosphotransferase system component IIB